MSSLINSSMFKSSSRVHFVSSLGPLPALFSLLPPEPRDAWLPALVPDYDLFLIGHPLYFFFISSSLSFFSLAILASSSLLRMSDFSKA